MTATGYISDTEEIVKAFWSLFLHDGSAAFKLSERSPLLPAMSAKDLPGGRTQILNVCRIRRIDRHPVEIDENSTLVSILDTDNLLHRNGHLVDPNNSEDDRAADSESDIAQDNGMEDPERSEQWDMSTKPNVPGLNQPIRQSNS